MLITAFRSFGNSIRIKDLWKLLASLFCGLCGKREIQGFFRIKGDRNGCCGIDFTLTPLYGLLVLLLLEEFYLVLHNSIG